MHWALMLCAKWLPNVSYCQSTCSLLQDGAISHKGTRLVSTGDFSDFTNLQFLFIKWKLLFYVVHVKILLHVDITCGSCYLLSLFNDEGGHPFFLSYLIVVVS